MFNLSDFFKFYLFKTSSTFLCIRNKNVYLFLYINNVVETQFK